jgi:hypothetical protein
MRVKLLGIFCMSIILTTGMDTGVFGQTNDMETNFKIGTTTKGYDVFASVANGRVWKTLDMQNRITYLTGIDDGLTLAKREGLNYDYLYEPTGFRFSEIAKQIDTFYADTVNLRIPVIEAHIYCKRKMKGDPPKDLADFEALLRKTYNK